MPRYRKKPVEVEAFQFTKDRSYDACAWPQWLIDAFDGKIRERGGNSIWITDDGWMCGTLEGPHEITFGDYIVQGVQGELYPCKPDIFEQTYDAA